jgi:PAS domain S-box-containing protein
MKDNELSQTGDSGGAPLPCPAKSSRRILVVDDDSGTCRCSLEVLTGSGYDVESVKDGAAGWDALQAKTYDLVITDNKMPKMSGMEMIEKLRAGRMTVPVILATAFAPTHEFDRKPWLKPDATLQRPFSNDDLLAAVKRVLRTDDRAHHLAGTPAESDQAGVRPSSGAATRAGSEVSEISNALGGTEPAAPEDGRTPEARPRFIPDHGDDGRKETRTEKTLRASEISYRRLFEAAKDGILILDADTGRINDVNPFLTKLLGFSHSEMVGKTVGELSPFKDVVSNQAMLERLQQNGYVRYEDLPLETKDGRHIAVEFVSNVYQAGDSKVIQCNVRDITERKKAEVVANRLAAIVESSDDAIIGKDLNSIITSWNRGAERLFGYTATEMVGTSIMRLIPADRQDEEGRILQKVKCGESVEHFDTLRQTKDGRLINISATVSLIKDASGKAIGLSKVARDISEHKAVEQKIRQLNAELEQRVVERTAQLQAANKELEAFSYSVSHDLRAPLRHVLGFVELLRKDAGPALSKESLGHLTTISQAAKQMGQLVDDLLAFSRIGQSEMQRTEVKLDRVVKQAVKTFQEETKARKIVWDIHPLPPVRADRALLGLVLVNLISNAVKFTGTRAEAKIEIGCAPGSDGETVIFIRDNGVGFDPRYTGKLFGVFQRLHGREEFEGTGIGLANVQRIIHRHGGRTWAEGVVDGGATFYFSIPKQSGDLHGH